MYRAGPPEGLFTVLGLGNSDEFFGENCHRVCPRCCLASIIVVNSPGELPVSLSTVLLCLNNCGKFPQRVVREFVSGAHCLGICGGILPKSCPSVCSRCIALLIVVKFSQRIGRELVHGGLLWQ